MGDRQSVATWAGRSHIDGDRTPPVIVLSFCEGGLLITRLDVQGASPGSGL